MDLDDVVPQVGFDDEDEREGTGAKTRSKNRRGAADRQGNPHKSLGAPMLRADSTGPSLLHGNGGNTSSFVDQLLNLQSVLFVLEVKEDDLTPTFRNIRRMDILDEAKKAARRARKAGGSGESVESGSIASLDDVGRQVPAASSAAPLQLNYGDARPPHGLSSPNDGMLLQARDLRSLDPKFYHSRDPALLVRRHCIVFSLGNVRALIFSDRVLFFPREGVDGEIQIILQHLKSSGNEDTAETLHTTQEPQPKRGSGDGNGDGGDDSESSDDDNDGDDGDHDLGFELRALEACLVAACDALQKELADYRHHTATLFRDLGLEQRAAQLEAMNAAGGQGDTAALAHPSEGTSGGGQGSGGVIQQAALTPNKLGSMSDIRRQLRSFRTRITAVAETLDDIMDDPADMSLLSLSVHEAAWRAMRPKEKAIRRLLRGSNPPAPMSPTFAGAGHGQGADGDGDGEGDGNGNVLGAVQQEFAEEQRKWSWNAERARQATELLLESYMGEVQSSIIGAKELEGDLAGMEGQAGLMLATKRNLLLRVDLDLSILTAALGAMAAVGGYFGMNLTSGVEESDHWFWTVLSVTASTFITLAVIFTIYVRRLLGGNDT